MIQSVSAGSLLTSQLLRRQGLEHLAAMTRLATLQRINRGADDSAGLIAAVELQSEIESSRAALRGVETANGLLRVADSALKNAGELVRQIKGDLVSAANSTISAEEREALQANIDASLDALDRIGRETQFQGEPLFDGQSRSFLVGTQPSTNATVTLDALQSANLGDGSGNLNQLRSGGALSLDSGDFAGASAVIGGALSQIANRRVEISSVQMATLDAAHSAMEDTYVNLSLALSHIYDADVAFESSILARTQILMHATILAAQVANERSRLTSHLLDLLI